MERVKNERVNRRNLRGSGSLCLERTSIIRVIQSEHNEFVGLVISAVKPEKVAVIELVIHYFARAS